ncbi:HD-GYP domain-containing protein [Marinicrinis sediminis]|uniref:HD-GYP domain-containing protein n=1 Tax=Marinicrinis sediminis TaxID=1652465 RepID=A0ABW5RAI2_9BACL
MRLVLTKNCKAGMKLARSIYNEQGLVLLHEQVELNDSLIRKMLTHGIDYVYIFDERTEDVECVHTIEPETRSRAITQIRQNFTRLVDQFQRKRTITSSADRELKQIVHMLFDDLKRHDQALIMLSDIRAANEYLFSHSLNVGIFSLIIGISLGYDEDELMQIGLGGLLHDIGKMQVNPHILNKPGPLTAQEMSAMRKHTEFGFQILKDIPNISLLSAHCALQHHERMDGSGYPRGIQGNEIHEYAQWIGLIDAYDAMTNHRAYREAMLPHQVLEILYTGAGSRYDIKKLEHFRDRIAVYPIGVTVQLNTGEKGVVVDLNAKVLHRPVIRILQDADGQSMEQPYELDLSKKLNLTIVDLIYEV